MLRKNLNLKKTHRKGASVVILVFSLLAILGVASFALDLGLILNQRYELQKAVESAALMAASEYELYEIDEGGSNMRLTLPATNLIDHNSIGIGAVNYQRLKNTNQLLAIGTDDTPDIVMENLTKGVKVSANASVPTFFISVFGIHEINIQAKAAAINIPFYLSGKRPAPSGSIINGVTAGGIQDTLIREPVGGAPVIPNPTAVVHNQNNNFDNIYGPPDGKALSLGPGGFITIKAPESIFDGKGADFIIYERGHAEGYYVFAGIDADLADPYKNIDDPGGGINWINISCTGAPLYASMDDDEMLGCHRSSVPIQMNGANVIEPKFYGSGIFDLGVQCVDSAGGIVYDGTSTAAAGSQKIGAIKYLKIIDDNIEDGFYLPPRYGFDSANPIHGIPMVIPGEHSTYSPGADLDAITILHHSRLINTSDIEDSDGDGDLDGDSDGDGLIDIVEQFYGYDPNNADSDGDGINDLIEHGYEPNDPLTVNDIPQNNLADPPEFLYKDYVNSAISPPVMIIEP